MDTNLNLPRLRHLQDAPRIERAQLARVVQLQAIDHLMKVMEKLTAHGFVPIGFKKCINGRITLQVEEPSDYMVDAVRGGNVMGGRFAPDCNQRWFMFNDVKVLWDVLVDEVAR